MIKQEKQAEVIIVGGGLAGLTAASYLAEAGVKVILCEKAAELGGRSATKDHHGYLFNHGAHALYTGGAATKVLQELEVNYPHGSPRDFFILQQGQVQQLPATPFGILSSSVFKGKEKLEFASVFTKLTMLKPHTVAAVSIEKWLQTHTKSQQVRQIMAAIARTNMYTAALHLVSMEAFAEKLQYSLKYPIHYIHGGWQTLVQLLRQKAERAGAQIMNSASVTSVLIKNGHAYGIQLRDGRQITATTVIIATTPQAAAKLVDREQYPAMSKIVNDLIPGQMACLDIAVSSLPSRITPVQDIEHAQFLTIQSLNAQIAPQGGALISTFKQLDPTQSTDPRDDERDLEHMLDTLQPGWRDVLVKRVFLPRIEAVGTLPLAKNGGFAGRPQPQVPDVQGLYLIGDWIGAEGFLIDTSLASARMVARLLLQERVNVTERQAVSV